MASITEGDRGIIWAQVNRPDQVHERLRNEHSPPGQAYGKGDAPMGAHSPVAQDTFARNLRKLAARGTTGATRGEVDLAPLISPHQSYEEAKQVVKEATGGAEFRTEEERRLRQERADAEDKARDHARNWLRERCAAIAEQTDVEAGDALERALDGDNPGFTGEVRVDAGTLTPDGLVNSVQEMADEFGTDLIEDVIEECRRDHDDAEQIQAPEEFRDFIFERAEEVLGFDPLSVESAVTGFETEIRRLEDELDRAEQQARDQLFNRISQAFGRQIDDVEQLQEFVDERTRRAREEALDTGKIAVTRRGDEFSVDVDEARTDVFEDHMDRIERRVREELLLEELADPDRQHVGTVEAEAGRLTEIDLSLGIDKLGARGDGEPLSQPSVSQAQEIAEEAIAFLEGPDAP